MTSCSSEGGDDVEKGDAGELNSPNEKWNGNHEYVLLPISDIAHLSVSTDRNYEILHLPFIAS